MYLEYLLENENITLIRKIEYEKFKICNVPRCPSFIHDTLFHPKCLEHGAGVMKC